MTRRELLAGGAGLAVRGKRPSILLMIGDNWAAPHASAYGDRVVRTPVFDRIANDGAMFEHAFGPNPSCSPSRSSLLCGQETHRLGDAANLYGSLDARYPTYTDLLEAAGYRVGYAGKGWAPGRVDKTGRKRNPAGEQFKSFDEFLRAQPGDKPFCFWFGSTNPHVPWDQGRADKEKLDASKVAMPPHLPDAPEVRDDILNYYCEAQEFDRQCGAMVEELRTRGELDNTLVVMTSDNGSQMPRGLAHCYDLGTRIPMAVRWADAFKPGTRRGDFVSIADLAPTFLEAAGVAVPGAMTARSLLRNTGRNAMFLERERHANVRRGDLAYPVRGIRTQDWLYLRNLEPDRWPAGDPELYWAVGKYGDIDDSQSKRLLMAKQPQPYFDLCMGKQAAEELYDLKSDPGQVKNLASTDRLVRTRKKLAARVPYYGPRRAG